MELPTENVNLIKILGYKVCSVCILEFFFFASAGAWYEDNVADIFRRLSPFFCGVSCDKSAAASESCSVCEQSSYDVDLKE